MSFAVAGDFASPVERALPYRNALAVAVLIACPVRRRAFCLIDIGNRLERTPDGYRLRFLGEDTKDRRARAYPLHVRLVAPLDTYLRTYRPVLLGNGASSALWPSYSGAPMAGYTMGMSITEFTERALGIRLTPHDFRRVAATSIAQYDPVHAGIIRDVLGHSTMDMADRYYNQARSLEAMEKLQAADAVRRGALARERRRR